jgi:glycerol kinase
MPKHILALDAGTTSARALLVDESSEIVTIAQREITQHYPQPGWIEHDPAELLSTQLEVMRAAMRDGNVSPSDLSAVALTNQRETAVVWEKDTGRPIYNAIVWASRQSTPVIERWREKGMHDLIRERTGLLSDAYYSASKIAWILDRVPGARERAEKGELLAGTVDTWLIWNLTGRTSFVTDYSNASRTMMYNIAKLDWDDDLLEGYDIPRVALAEVVSSDSIFGDVSATFGSAVPIASDLGDQQAGLFGQVCFSPGQAKMTYGTAGVLVLNSGGTPLEIEGLTASAAWGLKGAATYEVEGVLFAVGKTMQWLRDDLKLIHHAADSEWYGGQVASTEGVYLVPAFTGLAAPVWDPYARAAIIGMSNATTRLHVIRAAVESMVYQTRDVVDAVKAHEGQGISELRVDGGAVNNNMLCQLQADILGIPVIRPKVTEATAMGAAYMAGLTTGMFTDTEQVEQLWAVDRVFEPLMSEDQREEMYAGWLHARDLTRNWTQKVTTD